MRSIILIFVVAEHSKAFGSETIIDIYEPATFSTPDAMFSYLGTKQQRKEFPGEPIYL